MKHIRLALLGLTLPLVPIAAMGQRYGDLDYAVNGGSVTITGYSGHGGAVVIPSTIEDLPVTGIGGWAFYDCASLTNVTMDARLASIGAGAFCLCANLASLTIPSDVTSIGDYAFSDCAGLASVAMGSSATNIGEWAFYGCSSLASVTVPNSVTTIGDYAFDECAGLASVTLGSGVLSIGEGAFKNCGSLASLAIPASVTSVGEYAFWQCANLTSVLFLGNAPSADESLFTDVPGATFYYLPGTAGWGSAFWSSARLWNPKAQAAGLRNKQFGFDITGTPGLPILVETSTNLAGGLWAPLQTGTLIGGLLHVSDPGWKNYHARFYRIRWP